ncbi:MAG: FAD-binding oxidoreductase [Pseudomonadota bacterium]
MSDMEQDLRAIVGDAGLVKDDAVASRMGWPPYACKARLLVRPASTGEVAAVLKLCHAAGQPVVTHGGRTGLVGGCSTAAGDIILSLERMNRIEALDATGRTMTAQAGVVLGAAQDAAAAQGLHLALDLGARGSATIGGVISTNAGGNQVIRYGMMREQVLGLEAVLADGTVISALNWVLKNNAGYDLKQLFIGSEGTLGVVTRAVLRLRPALPARAAAFVASDAFAKLPALLSHMERALGGALSAFEAMWNNFYALTHAATTPPPLAPTHPYYVLIEASGADQQRLEEDFTAAFEAAFTQGLISDAVLAKSEGERAGFWRIRDNIPALAALAPFAAYDVSLPLAQMEDYVAAVESGLAQALGTARLVTFGHLGDGNLHLVVALGSSAAAARRASDDTVYGALKGRAGSISAEHGIGLEKKAYLDLSRSGEEIALMRSLKNTLDPKGILNPGKVVALPR